MRIGSSNGDVGEEYLLKMAHYGFRLLRKTRGYSSLLKWGKLSFYTKKNYKKNKMKNGYFMCQLVVREMDLTQ
jgi:hypothetical protein